MKYARIERERRFLLATLPTGISGEFKLITDLYIDGTRLRLRRVETHAGCVVSLKFTQKYIPAKSVEGHTITTNFYINEREFACLQELGGHTIRKQRFKHVLGIFDGAIDVFLDELHGLVLAEMEFDDDKSMSAMPVPEFAIAEVTNDPFYTGGSLSTVDQATLRRALQRWNST